MAVYTQVSDEQARTFLAGYDLGAFQRLEGIQTGVENSNFHLFTDRGRFILTLFEKRTRAEDLPFFLDFTDHLAKKGILCPNVMPDREGHMIGVAAGRPAAIISFLEGQSVTIQQITPGHCRMLGTLVGKMHLAAADFSQTRPNALSLRGWKELAQKSEDRADEVERGLAYFVETELSFLEKNWPRDLPRSVIHADIFPDNVFFKDGALSGVIDFYFSCTDFLAYDLALVINAWCFDAAWRFDPLKFKTFMDAYNEVRPLEERERQSLSLICRGAAMRILMTRLYDWINHDPKSFVKPHDPKDYIARLRFHQNESLNG